MMSNMRILNSLTLLKWFKANNPRPSCDPSCDFVISDRPT